MDRIEKLQEFLSKSPNDPFLNHALALEYVKLENDKAARTYFQQNLDNHPAYVATYYHLGKLLERTGQTDEAILTYEKGIQVARQANDMHAAGELQGAYDDLVY